MLFSRVYFFSLFCAYCCKYENKYLPLWFRKRIYTFSRRFTHCFFHATKDRHVFKPSVCFYTVLWTIVYLFSIFIYLFMNIYFGNLSYKVRENDLQSIVEEYGRVDSCKIIKDRETGRSKGFAFVEMPDNAEALKMIEELHEAELDGRNIIVREARPRA